MWSWHKLSPHLDVEISHDVELLDDHFLKASCEGWTNSIYQAIVKLPLLQMNHMEGLQEHFVV